MANLSGDQQRLECLEASELPCVNVGDAGGSGLVQRGATRLVLGFLPLGHDDILVRKDVVATYPHHGPRATGTVSHSLLAVVQAGSWQEFELTYTAGYFGVDDTGSIKICWRYAADLGTPQFDDPGAAHYVSARASNAATLALRYDPKDNVRPWGRTVQVKVLNGFLREGDRIEVRFGDRSGGGPGIRMQTFCESSFELRVLVGPVATYRFQQSAGGGGAHGRDRAGAAGALVCGAADGGRTGHAVPPVGEGGGPLGQPYGRGAGQFPPAAEPSGARAARLAADRRRAARRLPRQAFG